MQQKNPRPQKEKNMKLILREMAEKDVIWKLPLADQVNRKQFLRIQKQNTVLDLTSALNKFKTEIDFQDGILQKQFFSTILSHLIQTKMQMQQFYSLKNQENEQLKMFGIGYIAYVIQLIDKFKKIAKKNNDKKVQKQKKNKLPNPLFNILQRLAFFGISSTFIFALKEQDLQKRNFYDLVNRLCVFMLLLVKEYQRYDDLIGLNCFSITVLRITQTCFLLIGGVPQIIYYMFRENSDSPETVQNDNIIFWVSVIGYSVYFLLIFLCQWMTYFVIVLIQKYKKRKQQKAKEEKRHNSQSQEELRLILNQVVSKKKTA